MDNDEVFEATEVQVAAVFTEWDRQYREDPHGFMSDVEHLSTSEDEYGGLLSTYFLHYLARCPPTPTCVQPRP